MKKMCIIAATSIILVAGCGKDAVVIKVQDDINSIGEVTLEDELLIDKTYETYSTLTDKQKNQVDNYADLLAARDKINELKMEARESEIKQIVGEWNGLAIYANDKLTPIDKGLITGVINSDNTFEFKVNDKTFTGVWAEIDSGDLKEGEIAYNFVLNDGEQAAQGILSNQNTFNDKNSTFTLSMAFDDDNLWVQFEK